VTLRIYGHGGQLADSLRKRIASESVPTLWRLRGEEGAVLSLLACLVARWRALSICRRDSQQNSHHPLTENLPARRPGINCVCGHWHVSECYCGCTIYELDTGDFEDSFAESVLDFMAGIAAAANRQVGVIHRLLWYN